MRDNGNNGNGHDKNNHNHKNKHQTKKQQQKSLEIEVRRSNVLGFHIKGLTQMEIAQKLGIDQTTVSGDLRYIKQNANKQIIEMTDNVSFEYVKYTKVNDEAQKKLWEIANFEIDLTDNTIDPSLIMSANINNKIRVAALSTILVANNQRMEMLTGGTKTTHDHEGTTIMHHAYKVKEGSKSVEQLQKEEAARFIRDYKIGSIIR